MQSNNLISRSVCVNGAAGESAARGAEAKRKRLRTKGWNRTQRLASSLAADRASEQLLRPGCRLNLAAGLQLPAKVNNL